MSQRFNHSDDYRPTATLETLGHRARLLSVVRTHFADAGYVEVETPILSRDAVVDAWLEPFSTYDEFAGESIEYYLQTSPEFAMKRLLAAGATAIFQVTRAFRQGERGPIHNPEFTMVEWYRVDDTYYDQMQFVEELFLKVIAAAEEVVPPSRRRTVTSPFARMTYDAAFERYSGSRVLESGTSELIQLAKQHQIAVPDTLRADDRDGWLNLLLAECVEPELGRQTPTILHDYPASQAALATIRSDSPPVAERFELYVDGIELCNGYQELTDHNELRQRMRHQAKIRSGEGVRTLPTDNWLLAAMEAGLPPCAGVALGFDRLAMVALGKETLAEVMAFPIGRA